MDPRRSEARRLHVNMIRTFEKHIQSIYITHPLPMIKTTRKHKNELYPQMPYLRTGYRTRSDLLRIGTVGSTKSRSGWTDISLFSLHNKGSLE